MKEVKFHTDSPATVLMLSLGQGGNVTLEQGISTEVAVMSSAIATTLNQMNPSGESINVIAALLALLDPTASKDNQRELSVGLALGFQIMRDDELNRMSDDLKEVYLKGCATFSALVSNAKGVDGVHKLDKSEFEGSEEENF